MFIAKHTAIYKVHKQYPRNSALERGEVKEFYVVGVLGPTRLLLASQSRPEGSLCPTIPQAEGTGVLLSASVTSSASALHPDKVILSVLFSVLVFFSIDKQKASWGHLSVPFPSLSRDWEIAEAHTCKHVQ